MDANLFTVGASQEPKLINWCEDTHLLVQFCEEEDSTSIIPVKHVKMKEGLAVGDDCSVTWSNRKVYTGIVMCSGSMEKCSAMQEELDESDSDEEPGESDCDEQELRVENKEDCSDVPIQLLKERNIISGDSGFQETLEDISKKGEQGTYEDGEQVIVTDKECQPKVNTTKKSKKKITQITGKENTETAKQKATTDKQNSKRKSVAKDKPMPKKKKSDFDMWIGNAPSRANGDNKSGNHTDKELQYEHLFGEIGNVKDIIQEISKHQDAEFQEVKKQLQEVSSSTKSILATLVAEKLSSTLTKSQTASRDSSICTPLSTTEPNETNFSGAKGCNNSDTATTNPPVSQEVEIGNTSLEEADSELIPSSDLTPIFVKSCSRRNFATRIIRYLVDFDTRKRSNVHGKGKEQLDPQVVKYAKIKCFEYFPCPASAMKEEWSMCVIAIDESCRRLNKPKKRDIVEIQ